MTTVDEIIQLIADMDHGERIAVFKDETDDGPLSPSDNYDVVECWAAHVLVIALRYKLSGEDIIDLVNEPSKSSNNCKTDQYIEGADEAGTKVMESRPLPQISLKKFTGDELSEQWADLDRDYTSDNCDPEDAAIERIKNVTDQDRAKSVENIRAAISPISNSEDR